MQEIVYLHPDKNVPEPYLKNLFAVIELIDIPPEGKFKSYQTFLEDAQTPSDTMSEDLEGSVASEESFVFNYKEAKKAINQIWMGIIKYQLTADIYRRCLVLIPEKAICHLKSPVKLTDFFMEAFNLGNYIVFIKIFKEKKRD